MERALASIDTILELNPIPGADKIEVAKIKGWNVVVRIVDKLFRVANNNMGEEDAFQDITGYGLLAVVRNKR